MIIDYKFINSDTLLVTINSWFKEIEYIIIKGEVFDKIKCKFSKPKNCIFIDNIDNYITHKLLIIHIDNIEYNNVYTINSNTVHNSNNSNNSNNRGIYAIINKKIII